MSADLDFRKAWEIARRIQENFPPDTTAAAVYQAALILAANAATQMSVSKKEWLELCAHVWEAPPLVAFRAQSSS